MAKDELESLRYMTSFRCIGPDCEDHCCKGWIINLDHADYARVAALRDRSETVAEQFSVAVIRDHQDKREKKFAHLNFRPEGTCYFETDSMCMIHRDFGETALPKTCATYPRSARRVGEVFQLSGFLSCPEVARLCLLDPDSMDIVSAPWALLPENIDLLAQLPQQKDHYEQHLMWVRSKVLGLLEARHRSIEESLYLVLYQSRKVESFFHRGVSNDPKARLETAFARIEDEVFQAKILDRNTNETPEQARALIFLVLHARDNHANRSRFKSFVNKVMVGYGLGEDPNLEDPEVEHRLWQQYQERKAGLVKRYPQRLALYLRNYTLNLWYQEGLLGTQNLMEVVRRFILCFAVVKFLLFGHPSLPQLLAGEADEQWLDRIAVEAIQTFSKNMSHNSEMLDFLSEVMKDNGLVDVSSLAVLLNI